MYLPQVLHMLQTLHMRFTHSNLSAGVFLARVPMDRKEKITSDTLRISQAAMLLDVDPTTVLRWINKGYLQSIKYPSGSHRIKRSEIKRFLSEARNSDLPEIKKFRILIIDDDEFFGGVLREMLDNSGLPLSIRSNRDPLCALLEIGSFHPDLLIIDYKLGAIDGLTLIDKIKENREFGTIPIIMISGHIKTFDRETRPDVAAFLKKPFKSAELRSALVTCLNLETITAGSAS